MRRYLAALWMTGAVFAGGCVFTSRPLPPGHGEDSGTFVPPADTGVGESMDAGATRDDDCRPAFNTGAAGADAGFIRPDGQGCVPSPPWADGGAPRDAGDAGDATDAEDASDAGDVTDVTDATDVTDTTDATDVTEIGVGDGTDGEGLPGDALTGSAR